MKQCEIADEPPPPPRKVAWGSPVRMSKVVPLQEVVAVETLVDAVDAQNSENMSSDTKKREPQFVVRSKPQRPPVEQLAKKEATKTTKESKEIVQEVSEGATRLRKTAHRGMSFSTLYGLVTALVFIMKDSFSAGKLFSHFNVANATDLTSLPFGAVSNLVVMTPCYAGFLYLFKEYSAHSPLLYYGAMVPFAVGYLAFGLSSLVAWIFRENPPWAAAQQTATATLWSTQPATTEPGLSLDNIAELQSVPAVFAIIGCVLFIVGCIANLIHVWDLRPWHSYVKESSILANIFGIQHVWYGCVVFTVACGFFLAGELFDWFGVPGSLALYQTGIMTTILGRCLFLSPGIQAIESGEEFVYGASGHEVVHITAALTLVFRLFAAISIYRRQLRGKDHRTATTAADGAAGPTVPTLPAGSWSRKALVDPETLQRGRVEVQDDGTLMLHATVKRSKDGAWVEASCRFNRCDKLAVDTDGCLVKVAQAQAPRLTGRDVRFMSKLFDELDVDSTGFLNAGDICDVLSAFGVTNVTYNGVERVLKDLGLDAKQSTGGQLGIPEFVVLMSSQALHDPLRWKRAIEAMWAKCDEDGDGTITVDELFRVLNSDLGLQSVTRQLVAGFVQEHGTGVDGITKDDFVHILRGQFNRG